MTTTLTTTIRTDRLRKLVEYAISLEQSRQPIRDVLDTLPALYPDVFKFDKRGTYPVYLKYSNYGQNDVMNWFGLTNTQYYHLFLLNSQNPAWGENLPLDATVERIADSCLRFCDLAERGLI